MSLPLVFRTTLANVPAQVPYIGASPEYLMLWQALLGLRRRKRIGIAWFGRQQQAAAFDAAANAGTALLARQDLEFHSLQNGNARQPIGIWLATHRVMVDHSADHKNFADTAALVAQMDMVLSIDTSLAHLAGALGKPVWIMLPFSADWRWLVGRTDTPWYPTARLFRQKRPGDWDGVVAEVAQALSE